MKEKRSIITMDGQGNVALPSDLSTIFMSEWELCELFGIIAPTLRAGIKTLCKSGVLREHEIRRCIRLSDRCSVEVYNLETVVALAFRIDSFGASKVRNILLAKIMYRRKEKTYLFTLPFGGGRHC